MWRARNLNMLGLSARGLENVNFEIPDRFEFVVGENKFEVSSIQAEFLSPMVARARKADAGFMRYRVEVQDPEVQFENVLELSVGKSVKVTDKNYGFLVSIAKEFENEEMTRILVEMRDDKDINNENAVCIMMRRVEAGVDTERVTRYIATHFAAIAHDELLKLNRECMERVFSHQSFAIGSEHDKFNFIMDLIETRGKENIVLFRFVCFENLSTEDLRTFSRICMDVGPAELTLPLWERIFNTFSGVNRASDWSQGKIQVIEFDGCQGNMLNGIIGYLNRTLCGDDDNVATRQIVTVTASSVDGGHAPSSIVDYKSGSYFMSIDETDAWVCCDFKNRRIAPTSYTLKSIEKGVPIGNNLRSWVVEISDDGNNWTELDKRVMNSDLDGPDIAKNYKITADPVKGRYIRVRQIDVNHRTMHIMTLGAFEVFGTLIEE